ncbi:MAG: transposase [Candidatus Eisenbacteria bacterium]
MARPIRIEFPGAVYHVTSRGNQKQRIFLNRRDFSSFQSVLATVVETHKWVVHSHCLMPNHYHLLLETPEGKLSKGMKYLNGVYVQAFNRRHERVGHALQGRFTAILVERESYLLELCRYVVLNPVRAGLVSKPENWTWSSYAATMGLAPRPRFLEIDWVLSQFGRDAGSSRKAYQRFVLAGLKGGSPWDDLIGGVLMGREKFIEEMRPHFKEKESDRGISRSERFAARPSLERIFRRARVWPKCERAIRVAREGHGYTLKEIAAFLGVHRSLLIRELRKSQPGKKS